MILVLSALGKKIMHLFIVNIEKKKFTWAREFQTQLLHYFSKSDNKSNHHHGHQDYILTKFMSNQASKRPFRLSKPPGTRESNSCDVDLKMYLCYCYHPQKKIVCTGLWLLQPSFGIRVDQKSPVSKSKPNSILKKISNYWLWNVRTNFSKTFHRKKNPSVCFKCLIFLVYFRTVLSKLWWSIISLTSQIANPGALDWNNPSGVCTCTTVWILDMVCWFQWIIQSWSVVGTKKLSHNYMIPDLLFQWSLRSI